MRRKNDEELRQMETANTLLNRSPQFLSHNCLRAVLGQFEIVDTGHYTWKIVVGCERSLVRLAYHGQGWVQATEAYKRHLVPYNGLVALHSPPIGSFGLPVMNWRYSRRVGTS